MGLNLSKAEIDALGNDLIEEFLSILPTPVKVSREMVYHVNVSLHTYI